MSRVIVTGGAGFIGSHLVDALIGQGHDVMIVDDLSSGQLKNVHMDAQLVREDIGSERMRDLFRDFKPQYVFHLAAQKNVRASVENPSFDADVNIIGSLNIIEQAARFEVKRFIFASTGGAMYGETKKIPTPETVPPVPESPYGIAKFTAEQYLRFYRSAHGLSSVSLRYANVYGPRQDPKGEAGVVAIFAQRLLQGESLMVNGHGRQTRDYVYVEDVVNANLLAMERRFEGEVNIGTSQQTSVNTLAKMLLKISGRRARVQHRRALVGEVMKSALRPGLARQKLGWRAQVKLDEGLLRTMDWARKEWGQ